ncbi:cytochrome P450 [Ganoderma sinense ZZ0214-1]|uniref:Cytochrome P450 n=1 Tax=Ganoderma sinense ZZ0214-1 TaxID=1077348 RepID=A0A2G8SJV0_9APHY|nr:cytochrome P450 [Ganoderma sinense ZZ0214-1]
MISILESTSLSTTTYVSGAFVALGLLLLALRRVFDRRGVEHISGPPSPSFLFGHDYAYACQEEACSLEFQWMREYGATWRTRGAFGRDVLMTVDPKAIQHIMQKSSYNYTKKMTFVHSAWLLSGPGIVTVLGKVHQRHRKIMNPAFSAAHLRTFLPLFQRIASKLSDKWKGELVATGELNALLNRWLSRATLDVIGEAAFNYDYNALDGAGRSPIAKGYEDIFKDVDYLPNKATVLFRATWDYIPAPVLKLIRYIPIHPWTRLRNLNDLFRQYGWRIIREQGPNMDTEKKSTTKDIMSILIKANSSEDPKSRLDDEEIIAEMFTLTLAGHETTSNTLSFLLYELSRHQEYQARMRTEIRGVRARITARGGNEFTIEDLESLTLTMNAIKETLRFHSIVVGMPRVPEKDDVIPLAHPISSTTGEVITEIPVRAGQVIHVSFAGYHRLPDVWGEDADVWNPDRFFRIETGKQTNVGVFSNFVSTAAGVRACIGWRFSLIEMQAFVTELVENFQFDPPAEKVEIQRAFAGFVFGMFPVVKGQADRGGAMPIRISLAQ